MYVGRTKAGTFVRCKDFKDFELGCINICLSRS
jgi:hypothetical protein